MATNAPTATPDVAVPARHRRRWLWVGALAVVATLGAATWLALGLIDAARETRAAATEARADLERSGRALQAGDEPGARQAARAARRDLAQADTAASRLPVRLAAHLPVVSSPVADLRHLLAAAHILTGATERAATAQARLTGGRASVFHDGRIDLAGVATTTDDATAVLDEFGRARRELNRVRGGWLAPGARSARDATLRRLDQVERQLRPLVQALQVLPPAVGAAGPRTYLVAISNSSELKAWGGAPLAIALLRFEHGQVRVVRRGTVSEQQLIQSIRWPFVAGDPWHAPGSSSRFTSSGLSPNFPTSGEEILRAWRVLTGVRADGLIALDPTALASLLDVTGPVVTPGYGRVGGADLVRLVLADSYRHYRDQDVRHRYNQQLMDAVLARVLKGGKLLRQLRALGAAASGRHLQLYFRDRRLQAAARAHGLAGGLSAAAQDYLGVFTVNTNASKTDYYQRRWIEQRVQLATDRSARVDRAIRLANTAPDEGGGARTGYTTGWARPRVVAYLPGAADGITVRVDGKPAGWTSFRELGRRAVQVQVWLPPGTARTVTVSYRLPRAAVPIGNGLHYQLVADPQPIVHHAALRVVVLPPPGFKVTTQPGWSAAGRALVATQSLAGVVTLDLDLSR
jgi:Protein of unknown function (DUF4012)